MQMDLLWLIFCHRKFPITIAVATIHYFLYAKHYAKHFTCSISFDPLNNLVVWIERLSNPAEVTHLIELGFMLSFFSLKTCGQYLYVMGFIASTLTDVQMPKLGSQLCLSKPRFSSDNIFRKSFLALYNLS